MYWSSLNDDNDMDREVGLREVLIYWSGLINDNDMDREVGRRGVLVESLP